MVDANQKWGVDTAVNWMLKLAEFKPLWIEEPTNPDDVLGHKADTLWFYRPHCTTHLELHLYSYLVPAILDLDYDPDTTTADWSIRQSPRGYGRPGSG